MSSCGACCPLAAGLAWQCLWQDWACHNTVRGTPNAPQHHHHCRTGHGAERPEAWHMRYLQRHRGPHVPEKQEKKGHEKGPVSGPKQGPQRGIFFRIVDPPSGRSNWRLNIPRLDDKCCCCGSTTVVGACVRMVCSDRTTAGALHRRFGIIGAR